MALSPRDRRTLTIFGVIAGAALIVFLLLNVLRGGGGEEAAPPSVPGGPTPAPTVTPSPTPAQTLPPVAGPRDPFSIPPSLASGSATPPPSGTSSPPPTGTSTSPTPTPTTPSGGQSTTIGGKTLVLLDIFQGGTKVQVEVNGTVYTVSEGETFDGNFEFVSASGSCANFLYGDQGFTLCLPPVPK